MKEYDFYIVPTPIGNLGDITRRAIDTLKSVDIIACEDMRVTQKLLNHFDIKTKCISYHKFNEKVALVSDAGTPLFCDPGAIIVDELRKNNYTVTSLAGANAVATFLSQVPRKGEDFTFAGFLPKTKSQIENLLKKYKSTDLVFYESPNRILNTLQLIKEFRPNSRVGIGRELTKVFEEIVIDETEKVIKHFQNNTLKGEIVALVFREEEICSDIDIDEKISLLKTKNFKAKEISIILSELYKLNKNDIYKRCLT